MWKKKHGGFEHMGLSEEERTVDHPPKLASVLFFFFRLQQGMASKPNVKIDGSHLSLCAMRRAHRRTLIT
jgi:hypothetical protein